MALVLLGVNHKKVPLELREKFSIPEASLEQALGAMVDGSSVREGVILSTCNRSEIYAYGDSHSATLEKLEQFFASQGVMERCSLSQYTYTHTDADAVNHLMEVSSGLDSMIIGEGQILAQVKNAFALAQSKGHTGPIFNKLFETAVRAGKRARAETRICQGVSSISYAAVELAKKIFGDLSSCRVMLVGAGKMSELALKLLVSSGVKQIMVANRTMERAREISERCGGTIVPFEQLPENLKNADIIISSTSASHFVLTREAVAPGIKARKGKPLFIVDIAVPRDVEPQVAAIENVYLYNIDDLQDIVEQNLDRRCGEIEMVRAIVREESASFMHYLRARSVVPLVKNLRTYFEGKGQQELQRIFSRNSLSEKEKALLESFSNTLIQKLLHNPTVRLKEMAGGTLSEDTIEALGEIFRTKPEEKESE